MVTELGADAPVHLACGLIENDIIELLHHLARAKRSKVTTAFPRGASRVLLGHLSKVGTFVMELFLD